MFQVAIFMSDIMTKYGHVLQGAWKMLAIKDAAIDSGPMIDTELQELIKVNWDQAAEKRHSTVLALLAEIIARVARKTMGRPGYVTSADADQRGDLVSAA